MKSNFRRVFVSSISLALALTLIQPTLVYAGDGDLDTSFGVGGVVNSGFGDAGRGFARAMTVDSQDRVIVVGDNDTQEQFGIARYTPSGALDVSFGQGGKVVTDISPSIDIASAVKIDSQNRIVVAGVSDAGAGPNCCEYHFSFARYLSNGTLDTSFGNGTGKVITDFRSFNGASVGLAIDASNNIMLVGTVSQQPAPATISSDFMVMRMTAAGDLDSTFGNAGALSIDFENSEPYSGHDNDLGTAIAIDGQGRAVVAGAYCAIESTQSCDFATARLTQTGALDSTFGVGGRVVTNFLEQNDYAQGLAFASNGKIVVGGNGADGSGSISAVVRYNPDGSLDNTYGNGGKAYASAPTIGAPQQFALDSQGRAIVTGFDNQVVRAVRFRADGSVDTTFGLNGVASVGPSITSAQAVYTLASAVDSLDRPLIAGSVMGGDSVWRFMVLRFGAPTASSLVWTSNPLNLGQNTTLSVSASDTRSTITGAEYFIGETIEPGSGIPMSLQPDGRWSASFGSSLAADIYTVGVRVKNALGSWSPVVYDNLVVFDPNGPTNVVGKQDFVPSVIAGDTLPGLNSSAQTDPANYAFDVRFTPTGLVDQASEFTFCYDLSGKRCKKLQNNPFLLTATHFDSLNINGTSSSRGTYQGTATMLVDGNSSTVVFRVQARDGDRLDPGAPDAFTLQIYPSGSNPAVDAPMYQVSAQLPLPSSVRIR